MFEHMGLQGVVKRLKESLARQRSSDIELRRVQRVRIDELEREVAHLSRVMRALVDLCLERGVIARGDLERWLRKARRHDAMSADRRAAKARKAVHTVRRTPRKSGS